VPTAFSCTDIAAIARVSWVGKEGGGIPREQIYSTPPEGTYQGKERQEGA